MKPVFRAAAAALVLALAACQGSFGGGTAAPGVNPPVNPQAAAGPTPTPNGSPSAAPRAIPSGSSATYDFAEGPKGLQCPQVSGFTCLLRFNVIETPSPSPAPSGKNTPTPSPTPTPTPSPTPAGSASPSASPSATPAATHMTLELAALPSSAPKMSNPDPKAVATIPLLTVRMHADADVTLKGTAVATFTLPKEQIGGRGFALQLYHEQSLRHKTIDTFFGTYANSKLDGNAITFTLTLPEIPVKKNEVWLIVLYGDERPSATGSPAPRDDERPAASGSPDASASPSASPAPSPAPTGT